VTRPEVKVVCGIDNVDPIAYPPLHPEDIFISRKDLVPIQDMFRAEVFFSFLFRPGDNRGDQRVTRFEAWFGGRVQDDAAMVTESLLTIEPEQRFRNVSREIALSGSDTTLYLQVC